MSGLVLEAHGRGRGIYQFSQERADHHHENAGIET